MQVMRRFVGLVAVSLALGLASLAVPVPAAAAGGPPTITSLTPGSVPADGTVTVTGSGCDAGSPVSFSLWNTSGGLPLDKNSTETGWVADGTGGFSHAIDLDNGLPLYDGVGPNDAGVIASCTPTYDSGSASNPGADGSYVGLTPADPTVDVAVAATAAYGSMPTVTVTTRRATGSITLALDGTPVHTAGSSSGGTSLRLPAALALGAHSLTATFDEAPPGVPAVVDSATVTVVKATAVLTASPAKKRIRLGKKAKLTVVLVTGGAPATGTVQIKDGKKVRKTLTLTAADHGTATVKVRLTKRGKHKLRAVFLGNEYADPATSPKVKVKVV
jgi:hypothetical protein